MRGRFARRAAAIRPPRNALTVNHAGAADGDVVQSGAADEIRGICRAAGIFIQRQHPQGSIHTQIDLAGQADRSAQINSGWNRRRSAAGVRCGINRGLNRGGIGRDAIADRAVIGDVERASGICGNSGATQDCAIACRVPQNKAKTGKIRSNVERLTLLFFTMAPLFNRHCTIKASRWIWDQECIIFQ